MNVAPPPREEEVFDEGQNNTQSYDNQQVQAQKKAAYEAKVNAYDQQQIWKQEFIQLGGFTHLLECLVDLSLVEIKTTLELKVIKSLIQAIDKFRSHYQQAQASMNVDEGQAKSLMEI